jgi:RNA polymerase sigma factor (sigma-70 family)
MTDSTDAELLARCRRDPEAFAVLYDRHARMLLGWVASRCRDRETALDIVQETFARALRDAHRFRRRGDGSALPWLRTIALNLVRDWQRRGVVEDRARRQLGIPAGEAAEEGVAARSALRAALDQLPAEQRAAVEARVVLDADYEEIAALNGISRATARARVSRGLRSLRAILTKEEATR